MKQFLVTFESDKPDRKNNVPGWDFRHDAGYASTIKGARSIISRVRKYAPEDHPRNFQVFDMWADFPFGSPVLSVE